MKCPLTTPCVSSGLPANTRRSLDVGLVVGQRRRRWATTKPTLVEHLVFLGSHSSYSHVHPLQGAAKPHDVTSIFTLFYTLDFP